MSDVFDFSEALFLLKSNHRVCRSGWNGKGMWLVAIQLKTSEEGTDPKIVSKPWCPFIAMKTADDKMVPWLASQTDILAEDWSVFED